MPTVKEIITEYLKANKYDGLCNPDIECGCGLDDFCPCDDGPDRDCEPAYHHDCAKCKDYIYHTPDGEESCEWREYKDGCYKTQPQVAAFVAVVETEKGLRK